MTEDLKNFFKYPRPSTKVIVITEFDAKVEEYLSNYDIISKTKAQWIVSDTKGQKYTVFIPNKFNTCGKRVSHLIIDSRFEDDFLYTYIFPILTHPTERKVEIF